MKEEVLDNSEHIALYGLTEKLRAKAQELILEKDDLVYHICPRLDAAYSIILGALEFELFKLDLKALSLKRKIELVQAKINREERFNLREINAQIEQELTDYSQKLAAWEEKLEGALESVNTDVEGTVLSDKEKTALRSAYLFIVKKLHPDINKDLSAKELHLFEIAVKCYKSCDLQALNTIKILIEDDSTHQAEVKPQKLLEEQKSLKEFISRLEDQIKKIQESFPYNIKALLEDKKKLKGEEESLKNQIAEKKKEFLLYEKKLSALTGGIYEKTVH
jgi:hypothetical protein